MILLGSMDEACWGKRTGTDVEGFDQAVTVIFERMRGGEPGT